MMREVRGYCIGILLCCLTFFGASLTGCSAPDAPAWENFVDPSSAEYVMAPPQIGAIEATPGSRQITVHVLGVDPYATVVLFERKKGSTGAFVSLGSSPANQASFVDIVPDSVGQVVYYRVRSGNAAGALSPYSTSVHFAIP